MELIELPIGSNIGVEFMYNGVVIRKTTTITLIRNNIVVCDEVLDYNGDAVSLGDKMVRAVVRYIDDADTAYTFTGVVLQTCLLSGEFCMVLSNTSSDVADNKRTAERHYIGIDGTAKVKNSDYAVKVRDMSITGVAITHSGELNCDVPSDIKVDFNDTSLDEAVNLGVHLVRKSKSADGKELYGGEIKTTNVNISNYLAVKKSQVSYK